MIAAAGIYVLDNHIDRLADDHARASRLAHKLAELPGVNIDPARVRTNIVHFTLDDSVEPTPEQVCRRLMDEHRIGLNMYPPNLLRAVTHYWIDDAGVDRLVAALASVIG